MSLRQVLGIAMVLVSGIVCTGCLVLSLHPVYDDASIVFEESLVGSWEDREDNVSTIITRGEWRSYKITYRDQFGTQTLSGYLTAIGRERFLDVTIEHGIERGPLLVPAHGVCRLEKAGERLTIEALNYDWFYKAVGSRMLGKLEAVIDERQNVLLTSTTTDLRAWLAGHLTSEGVFAAPAVFERSHR